MTKKQAVADALQKWRVAQFGLKNAAINLGLAIWREHGEFMGTYDGKELCQRKAPEVRWTLAIMESVQARWNRQETDKRRKREKNEDAEPTGNHLTTTPRPRI